MSQLLAEMSHFDKDCEITCGNLAQFGAILAQLLAEMPDFDKDCANYLRKCRNFDKDCAITCGNVGILNKMRQRAASNGAITCGNVAF